MFGSSVRISGCILARNEEQRIEAALQSLQGWTDQIIVIDNESEDATVAIAKRYNALVLTAPRSANFDAARNLAIEHATGDWIFYLDADERVPLCLVQALLRILQERGQEFDAICIPFKHYFCGKWMEHSGWWPGYTRPQLLKKGRFRYNERLHSGVRVDGRTLYFPADDPEYAILHYSYDDLTHYLTKLNHYTDGEAESLLADRQSHSWQAQLAHFVLDWQGYYERGRADLDGMHGFVLAFCSAFYRFASRAKLWDLRRRRGELIGIDAVPASVEEMVAFMAKVAREGPGSWLSASPLHAHFQGDRVPQDWLFAPAKQTSEDKIKAKSKGGSGVAACIVARNEEDRIEAALQSLQGWVDRIIVVDNESDDHTAEIARRYTPYVITAPRAANFEEVRISVADRIEALAFETCDWLLYLDADERVLPALGEAIRHLVREHGHEFDALCLPFRNYFYGKWMQGGAWWPGYKGPQLLKKNTYRYGQHIHSGTNTEGRLLYFPAQDPELAVRHDAYDTITHYLTKLNAYTTAQAKVFDLHRESHSWQAQLAHFAYDWKVHYNDGNAQSDGMHGFVQSFLCAYYSFMVRAKLWDLRRQRGETASSEPVPASIEEMLQFMLQVIQQGPDPWLSARHHSASPRSIQTGDLMPRVPLLWHGPVADPSGYAADGRNLVLACLEAGESLVLAPQRWGEEEAGLSAEERTALQQCLGSIDLPADLFVSNTLPRLLRPAPNALFQIARTVFETDRLPVGWEKILNSVDRVWVPSEHCRKTFLRSGVTAEKIAILPEAVDPVFFSSTGNPWPLPGQHAFTFLSIFDWALHKGWDILLEAFTRTFGNDPDVGLVIKTWSSNGYAWEDIQEQADALLRNRLGKRLVDFPNLSIWQERIPATEMPRLYRAADGFVLPTRAEGWCRPLMEAMAIGLPTIATEWGGHTDYHDKAVGYPLSYTVQTVSPDGAREIPFFAGHQWAEPDIAHLQELLRYVVSHQDAARQKGQSARKHIAKYYTRQAIAEHLRRELAQCREMVARKSQTSPLPIAEHKDALLIQCASGDQTAFLDLTRTHHEAYARAHKMDYVCRSGPQQTERKSNWDKILLIRAALNKGIYKHIIWLDADTLIVDSQRDLREALPEGKWLGMARHANPGRGEHVWYNSGAIYLRNTPEARAYFEEVWNTWPVNHDWEDNMAMILVLGYAPERWTGVTVIGDEWNSTRLMNEVSSPVVKAWHGNGSVAERLQMMQAEIRALSSRAKMTSGLGAHPTEEPHGNEKRPLNPQAPAAIQSQSVRPDSPHGNRHRPLPIRPPSNPVAPDPVPAVDFRAVLGRPLRIRWEGDQFIRSSMALVNREFCLELLARDDVALSLVARANPWHTLSMQDDPRFEALQKHLNAPLSGPPDVVIRHHFPPNWSRPDAGKLVVIQPWELSHLPERDWIEGALHTADAVWAYSRFVRDTYVRSGVPAEKVHVVPLGVRKEVFHPDGPANLPPRCLASMTAHDREVFTHARTRFLFVGGTTIRKGADLLLKAYLEAFTAQDDVCLCVKDMGTRTFYQGENMGTTLKRLQADPTAPSVIYWEDDLTDEELAMLYRACTCVVLSYRGEGFGLSPLEGMACGRPAIVTAGGATDDYLDDVVALRVPYHRRLMPGFYKGPTAAPFDPWDIEPNHHALMDALRWVDSHPEDIAERGSAAHSHVVEANWTWERAAQIACGRLMALMETPEKPSSASATVWFEPPASKRRSKASSKKCSLSLCMIARNEEARIADALRSIAPYVDEMIVVDTGSTDRTREIARDCGARVFDFPWTDSFSEARNQSLEQARGEWIFWKDADDVTSAECGMQLRELIARHPERDAAYQVQVRIPPGPGEYSEAIVDHVKLFPNRPDIRFEFRIHEQVLPSLRRANIPIRFCDLYVTHANYDRSPEGQARKRQRDFHLLELDLKDHPDHPFILFSLGMTHLYATKEFEVAAHYLRRSLDGSDWRDSIVRKAYAMLTTARMHQGEWRVAVEVNKEGRSYYPDDAELLFQAGQLYQQEGWFDEARRILERLVGGKDDPHYRSVDIGLRTYRGWHELALLFRRMGDLRHCADVLRKIVEEYPSYLPAQTDLAATLKAMDKQAVVRNTGFANTDEVSIDTETPQRGSLEVNIQPGKNRKP